MKIVNKLQKAILLLSMIFLVVSCDEKSEEVVKLPTIYDIVSTDANFSILKKAIEKTSPASDNNSILNRVKGAGSYTVFAPTNAAFIAAGVTEASVDALNPASTVPADVSAISTLRRRLQNHILGVGTLSSDLPSDGYVKTFAAGVGSTTLSMYVNKSSGVVLNGGTANGGATVTTANIEASNGIVHVIDNVMTLPTLVNHIKANPSLSTLLAVVTSGVGGSFGDQSAVLNLLTTANSNAVYASNNTNPAITLFAPLNSAFTSATASGGFLTGANFDPATNLGTNVTKVLQYHVSQSLPFTPPAVATVGNLSAASNTAWSTSTTSDSTIRTIAPTSTTGTQTFLITRQTLKITELPAISAPASILKTVNIQATNGIIHTIDRVLQPVL
ncbi:MAG: fasciclin domain-containing protein [Flavobacterium sp.]|uniref:fasciclin domain-containing protein n=1 Tax=Flavobacterium sp. TaxID=239 RepID=UPI0022C50768|nr:fasciclin domain-containing protein [Flavobacterium sp.]MCZ8198288.1 fasciclin domain-containing protein [Flavobacterium sp.]